MNLFLPNRTVVDEVKLIQKIIFKGELIYEKEDIVYPRNCVPKNIIIEDPVNDNSKKESTLKPIFDIDDIFCIAGGMIIKFVINLFK